MPFRIFSLLTVLCLLSACAAPAATPTATLPSAKATRPPDTVTPTVAPTFTPLPPTLTPTEIPTPIPTLSAEDTKALLFGLLADSGGCQLPCLWGFTIGKTDPSILDNFLKQFDVIEQPGFAVWIENFYSSAGSQGQIIFVNLEETVAEKGKVFSRINLAYSYQEDMPGARTLKGLYLVADSNSVLNSETDWPRAYGSNFPDAFQFYLLPNVLTQLGKPQQVWLLTWPKDPVRSARPFHIALYYPDQGIFVYYEAYRETSGNNFIGCPSQASISLVIVDPAQKMEWSELVGADVVDYYKPLEAATSLTLDQFYEQFKDPANTACIHTPQSLWVEAK